MLQFDDLIVLPCDLGFQRVNLLAVLGDHPAQGELVLVELLHVGLIGASREHQGRRQQGERDRPVGFSHADSPY
jgi:hypothetical protein